MKGSLIEDLVIKRAAMDIGSVSLDLLVYKGLEGHGACACAPNILRRPCW